jgi:hypothetical protein
MDISTSIPKISAENFRRDNKVVFETPIKKMDGLEGKSDYVLDMNQNDQIDVTWEFGYNRMQKVDEPVLAESYEKIKDFGTSKETEIITQEQLKDLHIKDLSFVWGMLFCTCPETSISSNLRPVADMLKNNPSITPDAQWALDIKNDKFIVFEPKK